MKKKQEFDVKVCFRERSEKKRRTAVNEKVVRLINADRRMH